jgi:predicted nucleotide-binding protein (sugar kinase/HSP70/actin superfamily)
MIIDINLLFEGVSGIRKIIDKFKNDTDRENLVKQLEKISTRLLNELSVSRTHRSYIERWNNQHVKDGTSISDTSSHVRGLIQFVETSLNDNIIKAKRKDSKHNRQLEKNVVLTFYKKNAEDLKKLFDLYNSIIKLKVSQ